MALRERLRIPAIVAACALIGTLAAALVDRPARATPVASNNALYTACGRVFPDPHAYWPSPAQAPTRSPFAKGNATCSAVDFMTYDEMVTGSNYLEGLFPDFVEFYNLEEDFGDGDDCAISTDPLDYCSAGLPGTGAIRSREDLYMIRVTDERVPDKGKKYFVFPLSIHGIERAGAEAGTRAAEDLATWAYCEAVANNEQVAAPEESAAGATINCAQEGDIPHPILETTPDKSVSAGEALKNSAVYLMFANPDGWRRGDPDNIARFYQRYNGNGVDMNRDWPTIGYTFRPYTPWSEPETRGFGEVLQGIKKKWDGGIDLHGQLIDVAFSFTLLGASERDYAKNQRILQTVKGAWRDAENRLAWSPLIKPNDAAADDPRLYGVQWGTVWDTIGYTVTGSLGDWIDSPIGLGADGIDNEMSLSHLSNCGVGSCFLIDAEQLHVDGNKSLIYAMVNFTLQDEGNKFKVPGKVGYVHSPRVAKNSGRLITPPPTQGLEPQEPILDVALDVSNDYTYEFEVLGPNDGFYNGGIEGVATPVGQFQGIGPSSVTSLVLEAYRPAEQTPADEDLGCGEPEDAWEEVNRYYNQSSLYLQAGQAVHANAPLPGPYRICMTGGLVNAATQGAFVDLDISFTEEAALEDPGQLPYRATNMKFFTALKPFMKKDQLHRLDADDILAGKVDLDSFTSIVVADDAFPGWTEPLAEGPAQDPIVIEPPTAAFATAPCAYPTQPELPPTCYADFEFDVEAGINNQQLRVEWFAQAADANDWDLYLERQSVVSDEWFPVAQSATGSGHETVTVLTPPSGHYRARIVNWAAAPVTAQKLEITFSNEYAGPPRPKNKRSAAEVKEWAAALNSFVKGGGNLVLTDGAIENVQLMKLVPDKFVNHFTVYAGFIGFTRDGTTSTFDDPLAQNVDQPGAAEGPQFRHQTFEPVPIGYAIQDPDGADFNSSPITAVDQLTWEERGGRTVGITTGDQVTLGQLKVGKGVVRVIGPLIPMPTEQYYHPFGLANYAVTYSGYQVFNNSLQWERPGADDDDGRPGGRGDGGDDEGDDEADDDVAARPPTTEADGGGLPFTGAAILLLVMLAAAAIATGTAIVRRRRSAGN